eukprot:snap_masked-scaffold_6-processed-gene-5.34-mRNA-1 protein AED:0.15 eAED:0.15 QI:0/-1/0/1/-1/1/1/0/401
MQRNRKSTRLSNEVDEDVPLAPFPIPALISGFDEDGGELSLFPESKSSMQRVFSQLDSLQTEDSENLSSSVDQDEWKIETLKRYRNTENYKQHSDMGLPLAEDPPRVSAADSFEETLRKYQSFRSESFKNSETIAVENKKEYKRKRIFKCLLVVTLCVMVLLGGVIIMIFIDISEKNEAVEEVGTNNSQPFQTSTPSISPSKRPKNTPTISPSKPPTFAPIISPSVSPTLSPAFFPTSSPSSTPSTSPSVSPTKPPSSSPTTFPPLVPSSAPSASPSLFPTMQPSFLPSGSPIFSPTKQPTALPTELPTLSPSTSPSSIPTSSPSFSPTTSPTSLLEYYNEICSGSTGTAYTSSCVGSQLYIVCQVGSFVGQGFCTSSCDCPEYELYEGSLALCFGICTPV